MAHNKLFFKVLEFTRYLFAVMDGASRFILTHEISRVKKGVDPTGLFAASAARALRLPLILVSDGLAEFRNAATNVFETATNPNFVHVREIHLKNMFNQNNDVYKRLNGEFRDRLQCTRGFKSENPSIIRLLIIYHNFFRPHISLENNITPAEAIGLDIEPVPNSDLGVDCDKWITFIQNADINI